MLTHIYFFWNVSESLQSFFTNRLKDIDVQLIFPSAEQLTDKTYEGAEKAELLIGWRPTVELLAKASNMKVIINPGAGVQHLLPLLRPFAKANPQFTLLNNHGNDLLSAQHAVAMTLALCNQLIPHHNWMLDGQWRKGDKDAQSLPLAGVPIGLLGYGAINKAVQHMLSPFDPSFLVCRRTKADTNDSKTFLVEDRMSFLEQSRIVIIAVPQTTETINLIDEAELKALGPEGILINIARGPVVNQEALYKALSEKSIATAGIDVWYDYDPEPDADGNKRPYLLPFHELDNVLLSPHRAGQPIDYPPRWRQVFDNINRFAKGQALSNVVDLEQGY